MAAAEGASLTFEEGTLNPKAIVCGRCSSIIIAVGQATFVTLQVGMSFLEVTHSVAERAAMCHAEGPGTFRRRCRQRRCLKMLAAS